MEGLVRKNSNPDIFLVSAMKLRSQITFTAKLAVMFTVTLFWLFRISNAIQSKKPLHKGAPSILVLVKKTKLPENKIEERTVEWVLFGKLGITTIFTLVLTPFIYSLLPSLALARTHDGGRPSRALKNVEESNVQFG